MGPEISIGETFAGPFFFSGLSIYQVEEISILSHREIQAMPLNSPYHKESL